MKVTFPLSFKVGLVAGAVFVATPPETPAAGFHSQRRDVTV